MKWKFCIEDIGNEMETVEIIGDEFSDGQQSLSDALNNSSKVWTSPMFKICPLGLTIGEFFCKYKYDFWCKETSSFW